MANLKNLKVGQKVMVYNAPDGKAAATIVVIQDAVGKKIGVKFVDHHPSGHTLDGKCEKGYGWWTLPEYLGSL